MVLAREKHERAHAAILRGTLFVGCTATLTRSIFELAELHQSDPLFDAMVNSRFSSRLC